MSLYSVNLMDCYFHFNLYYYVIVGRMMTWEDIKRALLHFPVGVYVAWLITVNSALGIMMGFTFLIYEVMNDWRKEDKSYKDVYGYAIGLGIGAFGLYIWRLF